MNRVPWNHVKPGGVKLAMGHLLHGEAAPWNCALQTRAPGPIHTLMTCCTTHMCRVEHSFWPSLCHCSPPSLDPVCSTLCSNCHNCFLARHVILHDFCMTRTMHCAWFDSWALGRFNPLFFEPVGTSPHPAIWLRNVGLLSSQSEPGLMQHALLK